MKTNFKKNQGSVAAYEAAIGLTIFVIIVTAIFQALSFSIKQIQVLNTTSQTARYASLASTTSEQSITNYANNLLSIYNLNSSNPTITINAPQGISTPGGEITITINISTPIPENNILPDINSASNNKKRRNNINANEKSNAQTKWFICNLPNSGYATYNIFNNNIYN